MRNIFLSKWRPSNTLFIKIIIKLVAYIYCWRALASQHFIWEGQRCELTQKAQKIEFFWLKDSAHAQCGFSFSDVKNLFFVDLLWNYGNEQLSFFALHECHDQYFDDVLSNSGNEQFGYFNTWRHNRCVFDSARPHVFDSAQLLISS